MTGFASARSYVQVGLRTDVLNADPHRLILLLFDGALLSIRRAKGYLAERRIAEKCQALSNACEIVDNGLRVSVNREVDPEFSERLIALYKYVTMRLLQANLRNDVGAMDEAAGILDGLRNAWVRIAPGHAGEAAAAESSTRAEAPAGPARRLASAYQV